MSFEINDFKIYPFEKGKYYVVLCDPRFINFEDLMHSLNDFEGDGLFVPCKDPHKSTVQLTFDSIQSIEDWIKEVKEQLNDK